MRLGRRRRSRAGTTNREVGVDVDVDVDGEHHDVDAPERYTPFIHAWIERPLPTPSTDGPMDVLVWDIDKTYLDTRFSSMRGLLAIPFELAVDKRAIVGTVALLRSLRLGPLPSSPRFTPLYFVSGSPPSLRQVIMEKMLLDGVQPDGLIFKDQFGLLKARRPRAIKEQVGYKLNALLGLRARSVAPAGAYRFTFFGDDVEQDMTSFLLFGEVMAGLRGGPLDERLRSLGVAEPERRAAVARAADLVVEADPVARVCIHSARGRLLDAPDLDPRVKVTRSPAQAALVLRDDGLVDADAPARVQAECLARGIAQSQLDDWLRDATARLGVR